MTDFDYIMSLIDWNNPSNIQDIGINMAKKIKDIKLFFQPCTVNYNKNVWENCAKILAKKNDEILMPYLNLMFEWIQDLNWPGAFCMLERLKKYKDNESFLRAYKESMNYAMKIKDYVWIENLNIVYRNK